MVNFHLGGLAMRIKITLELVSQSSWLGAISSSKITTKEPYSPQRDMALSLPANDQPKSVSVEYGEWVEACAEVSFE